MPIGYTQVGPQGLPMSGGERINPTSCQVTLMHMPMVLVHFFLATACQRAYHIIVLGAEQTQQGVNTEEIPLLRSFKSDEEDTLYKTATENVICVFTGEEPGLVVQET